jgi:hypothetical protein
MAKSPRGTKGIGSDSMIAPRTTPFRFTVVLAFTVWRIHAIAARANLGFHCWVAGQRVKIFLALFPSAVHLDPLTVSGKAASRILRAGLLSLILISQPRISSIRDIARPMMVFSAPIGRSCMTAGRANIARIWQRPGKRLDVVGVQPIAGPKATVASNNRGGSR